MSTDITLPDYLADAEVTAYTDRNRRVLRWRINQPGSIYRNSFEKAEVELVERRGWDSANGFYVVAHRQQPGSYLFDVKFAEGAAQRISDDLQLVFTPEVLEAYWLSTFRFTESQKFLDGVTEAEQVARILSAGAALARRWEDEGPEGFTLVPVSAQISAWSPYSLKREWAEAALEVLEPNSLEPLGWITQTGQLVPRVEEAAR
jgi:hypothetical protein